MFKVTVIIRGLAREGESGATAPGGRNKTAAQYYIKKKKFSHSKFKFFSKRKGNSVNDCDFLKFIIHFTFMVPCIIIYSMK